jgi:hypothetical protein
MEQQARGRGGRGGWGQPRWKNESLRELISACSMQPGGATALLCANVDAASIKLVEHWKSDSMLPHLRAQAMVIGQRAAFPLEEALTPFKPTA